MPYNPRTNVCRLMTERYDTKSTVKLGGFRSQREASCVSSCPEELLYNETVYGSLYIAFKSVLMIKIF